LILERTVQLIRGGYSHAFGIEFGKHKEFCREVSRTIGFGIVQILKGTGNTFTTIPLPTGSRNRAMEYRYCSAYPGFKLDALPSAAEAIVA